MKLYHYCPVGNSCLEKGICSISLLPQFLYHYRQRANSDQNDKIIAWLESTFIGRSRSVACLTEPLKLKGNPIYDIGDLFSFDIHQLWQDGLIESIYCKTHPGNTEILKKININDIDWTPIDFSPFKTKNEVINTFFKHYFIVLKQGYIPPKYITKENK